MPSLLEILSTSFEQYSIVWIVISGIIGAVITAFTKFIFEHSLPQWQLKRSTRIAIQRYSFPLLRSSYNLEMTIRELLIGVYKFRLSDSKDDYFRLRILYFFGRFFGWCKILSNESVLEYIESGEIKSKSIENFAKHYDIIFKGISNVSYFYKANNIPPEEKESARIPALVVSSIGELMIKGATDSKEVSSNVISFREFTRCFEQNPEFKKWFAYLENLITGLESLETNAKWNRLIIFYTNLRVFINFLSRNKNQPSVGHNILQFVRKHFHQERNLYHIITENKAFKNIHPEVGKKILNDLDTLHFKISYT